MLIIDRFEGEIAIIEMNDSSIELPRKYLPDSAREGDVIKLIIDKEKTSARKKQIENLADSLFE